MNRRISGLLASAVFAIAGLLGSGPSFAQNAYITNEFSGTVSVISTPTNTVIATIPIGYLPYGVTVTPDGRRAYIGSLGIQSVAVIDTATNTVIANIPCGYSSGIATSPDGSQVYAANFFDQTLSVIDTRTNTLTAVVPGLGIYPYGVAVANGKVYAANWTSPATVTVVDTATNKVTAIIPAGSDANAPAVAASPDGRRVYVTNEIGDDVPVIDTATDTVIATIPVPVSISAAVSPDGSKIYIPNRGNHIAVVDTQTNNVIGGSDFINGGQFGVSVTPDGRKIYVANFDANLVTAVDAATGTVTAMIPVGSYPIALGNFIQPRPAFAGTPGKANCFGVSVAALVQQYGGLNAAAVALLGYPNVPALQQAIMAFCEG